MSNNNMELDSESHAVFTRILRGQPNILQTQSKQTDKKSQHKSRFKNFFAKIRKTKRSVITEDAKANELAYMETTKTSVKDRFTLASQLEKKHIIHSEGEFKQDVRDDIPDVSKLNHYIVREDILEEVRKGRYIMEIAPSDLVDFGGQRSYDMTHQLFVQHRGSFIIMFDGRYDLKKPLKEYPQGDVTSECKYS
ncbi:unnamed protein product [Mytilus coruscus]|uniref:Uncharacterized protein n=1 Tax=Mytilus coruscus TaxID=42192 RepID=A0A6J8ELF8_MYTCO|nr:unnamed protein product [Mytilus coruscus]